MKKILVTGAKGQLGNEIKHAENNKTVFNFLYTDVDALDITNYSALLDFYEKNSFDCIVNCAAYTNVDKAETDIENAESVNAKALANLAQLSSQYKIPLIHISTDYVFDGESCTPYKEDDKTNPQSVYGKTKLLGEEYAKNAFQYIIIRTAWLYSLYGKNFVRTMLRLGKEKDEIQVVADQTGSPTNAEDLAYAILAILRQIFDNPAKDFSGIYHFSGEGTCSWFEFAEEIMTASKTKCKVYPLSSEAYPAAAKRPKYSLLDKTKIKETFGLEIPHWKESLAKFLKKHTD